MDSVIVPPPAAKLIDERRSETLYQARSRLYRRRFLHPNTHFAAFFTIYKICILLHRSNLKFCRFFAILFRENLRIFSDFCKILLNFREISADLFKMLQTFCNIEHFLVNFQQKIEISAFQKRCIPKRCKGVRCVDLGESFQTHIFLQILASIQLRTSLVKFPVRKSFSVVVRQQAERLVVSKMLAFFLPPPLLFTFLTRARQLL